MMAAQRVFRADNFTQAPAPSPDAAVAVAEAADALVKRLNEISDRLEEVLLLLYGVVPKQS